MAEFWLQLYKAKIYIIFMFSEIDPNAFKTLILNSVKENLAHSTLNQTKNKPNQIICISNQTQEKEELYAKVRLIRCFSLCSSCFYFQIFSKLYPLAPVLTYFLIFSNLTAQPEILYSNKILCGEIPPFSAIYAK